MDRRVRFLYLSQEDVIAAGALDMSKRMADMEQLFRLWDQGDYIEAPTPIISWGEGLEGLFFVAHAAWVGGGVNATGIKWIASNPENRVKHRMSRSSAVIVLNDMQTGYPMAIMDGTIITAMRTGAVVGVAAKHLARRDAQVVGLIGTGFQSHAQALGLKMSLPQLRMYKIHNASPGPAQAWVEEMGRLLEVPIQIESSSRAVVEGSDVVVAATAGGRSGPVRVEPAWFAKGSFYSVLSPRDLNGNVIQEFDRVVLTKLEELEPGRVNALSDLYRAGVLKADNVTELAAIVVGKKPGRQNETERIFMRPTGMSAADVITAQSIYQQAKNMGLGQELDLWREPKWA